jgi:prepilin-type processing-associated H-X9-DG protein
VALSPAQIGRSSDLVLFCSAAKLDNSRPWWSSVKLPSDFPGWHLVGPPTVADVEQWRPYQQEPNNTVEALAGSDVFAPMGRFTGSVGTLFADGHVDTQSINGLYDQRKWINNAPGNRPNDAANKHAVCP